jgi:Protein of unknown function (DUF2568)
MRQPTGAGGSVKQQLACELRRRWSRPPSEDGAVRVPAKQTRPRRYRFSRRVRQEMAGLKAANVGFKFLLELGAIAAFAYWGASRSPVILAVILAIAVPAVFVVAWGTGRPRSPRRLARQTRMPFELGCFALAAAALIAAAAPVAGIAFAVVAAVNAVLLAAFGQLEA